MLQQHRITAPNTQLAADPHSAVQSCRLVRGGSTLINASCFWREATSATPVIDHGPELRWVLRPTRLRLKLSYVTSVRIPLLPNSVMCATARIGSLLAPCAGACS